MELPRNHFKRAIAEGRQQIGLWSTLPGAVATEALAGCGFDWLLLDTEHSPGDPLTVLAQLHAASAYPASIAVRPASNDPVLVKRFLDIGVQTLIIPYVQNAAEARAAAHALRYPPVGIRGVAGMTRATGYGRIADYTVRAEEELCLIVQIETATALAEIEAIAAIDGIDGLFIGPSDLAATMGFPGKPGHRQVVAAIEDAIRRIRRAGKPAGILSLDEDFCRRCIEIGTVFTAVGVDAHLLVKSAERLARRFKSPPDQASV